MASSTAAEAANSNFCYPDHQSAATHLMGQIAGGPDPSIFSNLMAVNNDPVNWQQESKIFVDDSSLRCVFPCEGNERPSQGLSLSLSSADPSSIGLQPFELRPMSNQHHGSVFGKSPVVMNMMQAAQVGQIQLRSSKYQGPAQELLNEFCSLGTDSAINKHQQSDTDDQTKQKTQKPNKQWDEDANGNIVSSSSNGKTDHPLSSLEFMELQKRKTKLLLLLEEVDRRYRHYIDQMKAVVSSFEAVAGQGAAKVYSALALKAMSRHFRCLRDAIVGQIKESKKAMGEKDPVAPGTSRGETPRLKIIDQALRQQRAFQQMSMMESHPWRPQRGLPEKSVSILRAWLFEHFLHPYPSDVDKHILARQTGLSRSQVSNWFINARVRLWKPMVEEMYLEETKEQAGTVESSYGPITDQEYGIAREIGNHHNSQVLYQRPEEQKPAIGQPIRIESERLSSIITSPDKNDYHLPFRSAHQANDPHSQQDHSILHQGFGQVGDSFGSMELDFASYNHHLAGGGPAVYGDHSTSHFGGGGVSLTLGLQQHGGSGGGVSLAFTDASQSSLFYPRDHHIGECQPGVQHSLLDEEGHNLPYRNLMEAQLLHDMAG
ncbi:hypothetical protein SAY86_011208 [Trapa natans]|uniref:Homeobox domain-containing protein n=1 Tax=Trapa natans TaxID=22666 RepID=A0AAN7LTG0_TRANT|nr:hypothetical protein SAY86_011208 [Trapa natans]